MKLKSQVCSLELSKRLKELGVKQESALFYWDLERDELMMGQEGGMPHFYTGDGRRSGGGKYVTLPDRTIAAFTVAELIEKLSGDEVSSLAIHKDIIEGWKIDISLRHGKDWTREYGGSPANALAKILIYLLENKLITL